MAYRAVIDIDDDQWCKHPYGITIYDDDTEIESQNWLDSRTQCYKISDKYDIPRNEVKERFY